MAIIHKLKVEPMTEDSFEPYGFILDAKDHPVDHRILATSDYEADGKTIVGVIWQPFQGQIFSQLERHFGVTQSFIQMSGSPAVVAVAVPTNLDDPMAIPSPEDVKAFLINPSKGFSFKVGTWHSLNRYVLSPPGATFAIINSVPNPTQLVDLEKNYSLTYTDLDSDKNPHRLDLEDGPGVSFEIGL